jgi:CheY-like chemotaxis protein
MIDPLAFINAAMDALHPAAEARGVGLNKMMSADIGEISADADRLQQVVWNLLSNAIKFTPRGGSIEVRLERVSSHVEIVVTDTGRGIKPEFLPFVFERFRQADSTITRTHGGLGLGLAIVRHLVELHGGEVHAYSKGDDQGATFIVRLPIVSVYDGQNPTKPTQARPHAGDTLPGVECPDRLDELKVLVVDDEPDTCDLLKTMLERCGAAVVVAGSAELALEVFERYTFDVVVSDIGMPGSDGYELKRMIRSLPEHRGGRTPAVALTAFARTEDRLRALRAGYEMHVPKPIEYSELVTVIASLAGRHSNRTPLE